MAEQELFEKQEPWKNRWAEQKTGWNLGEAHPYLVDLMEYAKTEGGLPKHARLYVPGCGHGHEAGSLASQSYQVVAVDFVDQAVQEAQALYGKISGLSFMQADVLELREQEKEAFDGIIDRAMLCALQPEYRSRYVESCWHRLREGGIFAGILFAEVDIPRDSGPPFDITEQELWELWGDRFDLVHLERRAPLSGHPPVIKSEWLAIWRKSAQRAGISK